MVMPYMSANSSAVSAVAVAPSDTVDLLRPSRMITVGGTGTVSFVGVDDVIYTTGLLPAGSYPLFAKRIRATGTTATDITAWN